MVYLVCNVDVECLCNIGFICDVVGDEGWEEFGECVLYIVYEMIDNVLVNDCNFGLVGFVFDVWYDGVVEVDNDVFCVCSVVNV